MAEETTSRVGGVAGSEMPQQKTRRATAAAAASPRCEGEEKETGTGKEEEKGEKEEKEENDIAADDGVRNDQESPEQKEEEDDSEDHGEVAGYDDDEDDDDDEDEEEDDEDDELQEEDNDNDSEAREACFRHRSTSSSSGRQANAMAAGPTLLETPSCLRYTEGEKERLVEHDQDVDNRVADIIRLTCEKLGGELTEWQLEYCSCDRLKRYLRGSKNEPRAAAQLLYDVLIWREEFKDILTCAREPNWQTDLRVLTRGEHGHPLVYGCLRYVNLPEAKNVQDTIEQMVAVFEAGSRERRRGATRGDLVMDCHGYTRRAHIDPTLVRSLMRMANAPYREGLRFAIVVDAPSSFQILWRIASPLLGHRTKARVHFVSLEEAIRLIRFNNGDRAAAVVENVMRLNRTPKGCEPRSFPSECVEEDDDAAQPQAEAGNDGHGFAEAEDEDRILSREEVQTVYKQKVEERRPWYAWLCCQRREKVRFRHVHFATPTAD